MTQFKTLLHWSKAALMLCVAAAIAPQSIKAELVEEDGVYQIATGQDLADFANLVNGSDTKNQQAVLTADIDMTGVEFTPIGARDKGYKGTFDGQRHVISNLVINTPDQEMVGVFGSIANGAVVKNFTVDQTCSFTGKAFMGVVGGYTGEAGSFLIDGIGSKADFTGSGANVSGIFGVNMGNAASGFVISNCYVSGNITGGNESAAISGWATNGTVKNCYSIAKVTGIQSNELEFVRHSGITVINCYDINGYGKAVAISSIKDAAYGKLTYLLNGDQSEIYFTQDLGKELYPTLTGDARVYIATLSGLDCAGRPLVPTEDIVYTNNPQVIPAHNYEDGFCTVCGKFNPDAFELVDGAFEIANGKQLYWFATYNNTVDNTANARVVADIDYTEYDEMIGTFRSKDFRGIFDGQGHTIKVNFAKMNGSDNCALFVSANGATIKNVRIEGDIESNGKYAAGLISHTLGGTKIENIETDVNILSHVSGDATNAGLVAVVEEETFISDVLILGSQATDNGTSNCGGIVGWSSNISHITDAIIASDITVGTSSSNVVSRNIGNVDAKNIFYTIPFADLSKAAQADEEMIANGAYAVLLGWGQKLGVDAMPSPLSSDKVYKYGAELTNEYMPNLEMPILSTPENPVFYYINNARSGKFVKYQGGAQMTQESTAGEPANMFYFVAAGEPDGSYVPVTIHNVLSAGTNMADFETWNGNDNYWHIYSNSSMSKNGLYIGTSKDTGANAWWNDHSQARVGSWACDAGSIWQFTAVPVEEVPALATITYNHVMGEKIFKTEVFPVLAGSEFPAPTLPAFVEAETPEGTADENNTIDVEVAFNTPFEASESFETANWYRILSKPGVAPRFLQYQEGEDLECYNMAGTANGDDKFFWAFNGNPYEGYTIYNRAAGAGMVLNVDAPANGAAPMMAAESANKWQIDCREGEIFGFGVGGFWINQYGGGDSSAMKLWQSGPKKDVGSTLGVAIALDDLLEDATESRVVEYDGVIGLGTTTKLTYTGGSQDIQAAAGAKAILNDYFNGNIYEIALTNNNGKVDINLPAGIGKLFYVTIPAASLKVQGSVEDNIDELNFTYYMNGLLLDEEAFVELIKAQSEATGIEGIKATKASDIYTLDGLRIEKQQRGVNIVNGHKFIKK